MGIYDRDYTQADSPFGRSKRVGNFLVPAPGWWSLTAILMIINIAVFVLDSILFKFIGIRANFHGFAKPILFYWGHFSSSLGFGDFQIWRVISFQFLHAGVGHLFWNMLGLFFFGPMVEQYLGSKRFVAYYLLCGVAGAIFYMLMMMLGIVDSSGIAPLIGASAGLFGIMVAAARIAPSMKVLFMFIIPIQLRTMIWFALGLAALTLVSKGHNAGGEAAHLGGAALGFLLISKPSVLNFADRFGQRNGPSLIQRAQQRKQQHAQQSQEKLDAEVDRILAKVKNQGLQSLTDKEKYVLQKATHQQRRN
ncbi:rhomboid family intramembrane serine protease [bacterium AH-315-I18]|nr:rhomboid family intramembrane serine protease [Phycisphaeraceae bacterium]MBN4060875.1 rhomboid family intramembrane serine protease [bacterium AH-315-I18]